MERAWKNFREWGLQIYLLINLESKNEKNVAQEFIPFPSPNQQVNQSKSR